MKQTVLITGGSRGIGATLATEFARAGYQIALNCRNEDSAATDGAQVIAACQAYGVKAACFVADVSDFDACGAMLKEIQKEFDTIEVLINNAGITRDGLVVRMSEQAFDDVINVNLKGTFNTIRHTAPLMMRKRKGWIINLSSVAGVYGNPGQVNYSASKAGVVGITKSVAKELAPRGIICNAIAPGFIKTDMTDALPEEVQKQMLEAIGLGRFGTPEDVAEAALFLASTTYLTGQVLVVDGAIAM